MKFMLSDTRPKEACDMLAQQQKGLVDISPDTCKASLALRGYAIVLFLSEGNGGPW